MKGLIIKPKWADLILSGDKTWEIRGSQTHHRGEIGIIKSGTKQVYGTVELVNCAPLTMYNWAANQDKHLVSYADVDYKTPYAWVLQPDHIHMLVNSSKDERIELYGIFKGEECVNDLR